MKAGAGLESLRAALLRPVFPLYPGRKSCPLSAPVAPGIIDAEDAETALRQVELPPWYPTRSRVARVLHTEDGPAGHRELRHDAALDRKRWHFTTRDVWTRAVDIRPEAS